jgi:exonuclease SbcC
VRTLSGGETFLASLALALALAEATADLAPAGAPTIESIFLDEGFGTLDPETLDTVAAAIEELGASGRMVVVVTHIRELADRMPVRLEVRRGITGSTVRRADL